MNPGVCRGVCGCVRRAPPGADARTAAAFASAVSAGWLGPSRPSTVRALRLRRSPTVAAAAAVAAAVKVLRSPIPLLPSSACRSASCAWILRLSDCSNEIHVTFNLCCWQVQSI